MFFNKNKKKNFQNNNSKNFNSAIKNFNSETYYYSSNSENNLFKKPQSNKKNNLYDEIKNPYYKKNQNNNLQFQGNNNENPLYEKYDLNKKFKAVDFNTFNSTTRNNYKLKSPELNESCFSCKVTSVVTTLGISSYMFYQSYSIRNSKELLKQIGPKKVLFRSRFAGAVGLGKYTIKKFFSISL